MLVIVNDGASSWLADKAELLATMTAQGWRKTGRIWVKPDSADDAYSELCRAIKPLADYEPDSAIVFSFRPDIGAGAFA